MKYRVVINIWYKPSMVFGLFFNGLKDYTVLYNVYNPKTKDQYLDHIKYTGNDHISNYSTKELLSTMKNFAI